MNTLIVYVSKTGVTEKCAGMLEQKLKGVKLVNLAYENPDIQNYDLIIVGSNIRFGRISAKVRSFINKNKTELLNKKVGYYICCGFADESNKYFEENISKELLDNAVCYDCFGGEMNLEKQTGFDKLVIKLVNKVIKEKIESKILTERINKFVERVFS
jgi:menaquinone-dependent protoporphyrinogen oxidase